jgi:hypothetical protein
MFNYVVKDPDSSGLSREFWIKDQKGLSHSLVSSNLVALRLLIAARNELLYSGLHSTRLRSFSVAQRLARTF